MFSKKARKIRMKESEKKHLWGGIISFFQQLVMLREHAVGSAVRSKCVWNKWLHTSAMLNRPKKLAQISEGVKHTRQKFTGIRLLKSRRKFRQQLRTQSSSFSGRRQENVATTVISEKRYFSQYVGNAENNRVTITHSEIARANAISEKYSCAAIISKFPCHSAF